MMSSHGAHNGERGFTIVEVLVAAMVLIVGLLGAVSLIDGAIATTSRTKEREAATNLAREVLEQARSIPYVHLTPEELQSRLQSNSGLEDYSGQSGWQIRRRGFTYTVTASVCSIDDAKDGTGPHDAGTFCSDSAGSSSSNPVLDFSGGSSAGGTSGAVDGSVSIGGGTPDDYKRVTLTLSWGSPLRQITQATLISNPGTSAGPSITLLAAAGLSSTTVTSISSSIGFNVTTSITPATVRWSVDGSVQGAATGAGTAWSFTWLTPTTLADGTYLISTQAYDSFGISGAPRSLSITLNRNSPAAPTGFRAGRNGSVVDLEWNANPERDIVGYRVYRVNSGTADTLVCPLTTKLECQDTSPPPGTVAYYAVALDRDANGSLREGYRSATDNATATNNPPNPPANLTASTSNGTTILHWDAPSPADPDPGGSIAFYRIYRDGQTYGDRYAITSSGTSTSYTDTHTDGTTHTYYVTAVDDNLAESTLVGPVTR